MIKMKKSKRYLWIMMIVLLAVAIIFAVVDWLTPYSYFWKGYYINLSTTALGIIVSIFLIEIIIENTRKEEQKETSRKKAERITLVLKPFLRNYQYAAIVISNKIADTGKHPTIKRDFPFTNLSELYNIQTLVMEPRREPKVELYFKKVDRLKSVILNILLNVDLTECPYFSEMLASYIEEMERDYPKDVLLNYQNNYSQDQTGKRTEMTSTIAKMIRNYKGDDLNENHLLRPVKRLYDIIQYHIDFIEKYNELLVKGLR